LTSGLLRSFDYGLRMKSIFIGFFLNLLVPSTPTFYGYP